MRGAMPAGGTMAAGGGLLAAGLTSMLMTGGMSTPIVIAAAVAAGIAGLLRGGHNQREFEKAGTAAAIDRIQGRTGDVMASTSIQGIRDQMKAYDDFLADPEAMKVAAQQLDVDYDKYKSGLQAGGPEFRAEAELRIEAWNDSIDQISQDNINSMERIKAAQENVCETIDKGIKVIGIGLIGLHGLLISILASNVWFS